MHHKGRNSHHYEYWQDDFDHGGTPLKMPFDDVCEMLCDYLGAGHAYMGKDFTFEGEWQWWLNKISKPIAMHPKTKYFINHVLNDLRLCDDDSNEIRHILSRQRLRLVYNSIEGMKE